MGPSKALVLGLAKVWQGFCKGLARGLARCLAKVWQGSGRVLARVLHGVWQGFGRGLAGLWHEIRQGFGNGLNLFVCFRNLLVTIRRYYFNRKASAFLLLRCLSAPRGFQVFLPVFKLLDFKWTLQTSRNQ